MWLVFLGIHLIGLSGYNLMLRRALVSNLDRWTLATIMQTAIAVPMVLVILSGHYRAAHYTLPTILLMLANMTLVIMLHWSNVKSLQYLEASVYSVLYNLRIIFTTILGIVFFREKTLLLQVLGGAMIFLAILLVRQKGSKGLTRRGLEWGVTASVVISLLNLTEKSFINRAGYLEYSIPVILTATVIMWSVLMARKQKVSSAIFRDPRTLLLMVFRAMSAYGFTLAFYYGAAISVASYISSLSVIIIVVLGIVILKERDYLRQKLWAVAIAVLGLTLILLGAVFKI